MYSSLEIRILLESSGRFCKPNSCWSWKFFHPLADLFLDNSKFTLVNKNSKLQVLASTRIRNFRTVDQEWSSLWSIDRRSSNHQIRLFGVRISILFGLSIVRSIRRYKVRVEKRGGERIDYPSVIDLIVGRASGIDRRRGGRGGRGAAVRVGPAARRVVRVC